MTTAAKSLYADAIFLASPRDVQRKMIVDRIHGSQESIKVLISENYKAGDMNEVAICRAMLATLERMEREMKP